MRHQPSPLLDTLLDGQFKGYPQGAPPMSLAEASRQGWNLLHGDLGLPALVIRQDAMEHNRAFMRGFLAMHGAAFCPHGKTTMAPQLFARQMEDGAWGITVANAHQARIALSHGFRRLTLANQVIHGPELNWIQSVMSEDPETEIRILVDSLDGLARLEAIPGDRPFSVLLELGLSGARVGLRVLDEALHLARRIAASSRAILVGVECFEALAGTGSAEEATSRVDAFLSGLASLALRIQAEGCFAGGEIWVTAGGSAYFDRVAKLSRELAPPSAWCFEAAAT